MIKDDNKDIDRISYNHLNLPHKITFANGTSIEYIYNAVGQKVRKIVRQLDVTNTDYMGGFQYVAGKLNFFPHAEGYVNVTVGRKGTIIYNYVYQYKDHLGNNRLSYTFDIDAILLIDEPIPLTILEENHYYPFGLKHSNYNTNQYEFIEVENGNDYYINITQLPAGGVSSYKYKYNGKEYQDELGLNMYDYGARNYDPAIGRWMNIDPLAEKYFSLSSYVYVANMPTIAIDPDGRDIVIIGSPEYRQKVLNELKNLSKTNSGATQVYKAINSKNTLYIYDPSDDSRANNINSFNKDKGYEALAFNFDKANESHTENGEEVENTASTTLIHELGHFNSDEGEDGYLNDDEGNSTRYLGEEVPATEIENEYRKEVGMKPRTHYGTSKDNSVKTFGKKLAGQDSRGNYNTSNKKDYAKSKTTVGKFSFKRVTEKKSSNIYGQGGRFIRVKGSDGKQIRLKDAKKG